MRARPGREMLDPYLDDGVRSGVSVMRSSKFRLGLAASAALLLSAAPAAAATQLVDGGFEAQASGVGQFCYFNFGTVCPTGAWTGGTIGNGGGGGFQDEQNFAWPGLATPDGVKYAFIQMLGFIQQSFVAGDTGTYNLSWLHAGRSNSQFSGNQNYDVLVNGVVVASSSTVTYENWGAVGSSNFNLVAGQAYTVRFQGLVETDFPATFIDAVSLNAAAPVGGIPEPSTWAMLILGFGAIGGALRSRRRYHTA